MSLHAPYGAPSPASRRTVGSPVSVGPTQTRCRVRPPTSRSATSSVADALGDPDALATEAAVAELVAAGPVGPVEAAPPQATTRRVPARMLRARATER